MASLKGVKTPITEKLYLKAVWKELFNSWPDVKLTPPTNKHIEIMNSMQKIVQGSMISRMIQILSDREKIINATIPTFCFRIKRNGK